MSGRVYHFHTVGGDSLEQTPPTSSIDDVDGIMYEAELRILDDTPPLDLNFDLICDSNTYKVSHCYPRVHIASVSAGGYPRVHIASVSTGGYPRVHIASVSAGGYPRVHIASVSAGGYPRVHIASVSAGGYPRVHIASVFHCVYNMQRIALNRVLLFDSRRQTYDQTRRCADILMLLRQVSVSSVLFVGEGSTS